MNLGIKAPHLCASLRECRRNAPNQGCGGIFFFLMHGQIIQIYLNNGVSL